MLYPLKLHPYYRHGEETPWGGRALGDVLGKDIPDDRTGESLEISALAGMQSTIENGEFASMPLTSALDAWGSRLTGQAEAGFSLLVKLLNAREPLSVQVHPGDDFAAAHEGKRGKTEAWVVLSAPPGARLVYGLDAKGRTLCEIIAQGALEASLNWIPVYPGDVLYIPSGLVHALGGSQGAGDMLVYEIQQSSDVTYRLWDWGRVGADGAPRALHTEKAAAVARADLSIPKLSGATVLCEGGSITFYVANRYFELSRLNVAGDMPLPTGRMLLLTALGACGVTWPEGRVSLAPGDSILIPAELAGVHITGQLPVLCASTPDRAQLREALGYRAPAVAGIEEDE